LPQSNLRQTGKTGNRQAIKQDSTSAMSFIGARRSFAE
jgi:hypothetical protein